MLVKFFWDIVIILCFYKSFFTIAGEISYLRIENTIPCKNDSVDYSLSVHLNISDLRENISVQFGLSTSSIRDCWIRIRNARCLENYTNCACKHVEKHVLNVKIFSTPVNKETYLKIHFLNNENITTTLKVCDSSIANTEFNMYASMLPCMVSIVLVIALVFGAIIKQYDKAKYFHNGQLAVDIKGTVEYNNSDVYSLEKFDIYDIIEMPLRIGSEEHLERDFKDLTARHTINTLL